MSQAPPRGGDDWEGRAIRVVVALERATDELAALIDEMRRKAKEKEADDDDGPH
jgi:hypothetical protein